MAKSSNKIESEKLEQLEKVVKVVTWKVISLENQITKIKDKIYASYLKENSSTPKENKDKGEESKNKDDFLLGKLCKYK